MAAYLIVDVDDLLHRFQARNMNVDVREFAIGLRAGAALAAGLASPDRLKAIAIADWSRHSVRMSTQNLELTFKNAGYDTFNLTERAAITDVIYIHYFSFDPEPIDELILATTSRDLLPLVHRVKTTRTARVRMWGSEDVLQGTPYASEIVFQPLETLLGIKSNNVAVFIDFENIAISLSENGYVLNFDHLIAKFISQARAYGQVIKMAAYAPWGQRGTLPPLVDGHGREISDDAPARLMMSNIDPVYNLPGKNSADVRIARDVITDATHQNSSDIYILASGDRDFNQVVNTVIQNGKTVVIWGVKGSTSRQLSSHQSVTVEYIDDFADLKKHQTLINASVTADTGEDFLPSQWSSVVIQFDRLSANRESYQLSIEEVVQELCRVGVVISPELAEELVKQTISLGALRQVSPLMVELNPLSPIVEKTRAIVEAMVRRVGNTLKVRGWQYVNYGFLLKGIEMEREITRPGMNLDDQWRSQWIDALVREGLLKRELIPHRHNPDDLVPVISVPEGYDSLRLYGEVPVYTGSPPVQVDSWIDMSPETLFKLDENTYQMVVRIIVSVEQFTSFRKFAWCPLGSLHKRLRPFDTNMAFQRAVEYLESNELALVGEHENPQSLYRTKGITLDATLPFAIEVLSIRDEVVRLLVSMYERNVIISEAHIRQEAPEALWNPKLWLSIMETENVINTLPGRIGMFSLFRTHHTVKRVMGEQVED